MAKKLILLLVLVWVLTSANAFAATLINDNFDSYIPGNTPGGSWFTHEDGGTINVVNSISFSSPNSVRIQRTDFSSGSRCNFGIFHPPVTNRVVYEAEIYASTVNREALVMWAWDSVHDLMGPWVSIGAISGYLAYYDGSNWSNIMAVSNNTWYHVRLDVDVPSNTFSVYVNNTLMVSGADFRQNSSVMALDSVWFDVFNGFNPPQQGDYANVDNVLTSIPCNREAGQVCYTFCSPGNCPPSTCSIYVPGLIGGCINIGQLSYCPCPFEVCPPTMGLCQIFIPTLQR
jgi:hypothetical protein